MKKQLLKNSTMLCSVLALNTLPALAGGLPSGGQVASGSATINQQGANRLVINQNSDKAIINWQDFSVASGSSVHFQQPSSSSSTLNRVLSSTPSTIAGRITGTGNVFLVNPNGILITKDGLIDTNSFLGSTLDIQNEDFLKENYIFSKQKGKKNALVENRGQITASGFVALMGGAVESHGIIRVHLGRIGLGAGEEIILTMGNNDFLRVAVSTRDLKGLRNSEGNTVSSVINHSGQLIADGGFIDISVKSARHILRQVVNLNGIAQARTVNKKKGRIVFGGADSFTGNGKLDVSAKNSDGGQADTGASAGDIDVDVGHINFSGKMHARSDTGDGGSIDVNASGAVSLSQGAEFDASGEKDGGRISLIGGQKRLMGSADFKARGETGNGGQVDISTRGGTVALLSGKIDASGHDRGGLVRIGGAFQGGRYNAKTSSLSQSAKDSFVNRWSEHAKHIIPNSKRTSLSIGYKVNASARGDTGTGGTIVLWSDGQTNQLGSMIATGKKLGGSIEISGKQKIGTINASKQQVGAGGHILFDPKNVTIVKSRGLSLLKKLAHVPATLSLNSDIFGSSVALSDDGGRMAVGADYDSTAGRFRGALYLFKVNWNTGAITQVKKITHGTNIGSGNTLSLQDKSFFGDSVALNNDGDKMVVGSSTTYHQDSAMYLFKVDWNTGAITQVKKITHGTNIGGGRTLSLQGISSIGDSVNLTFEGVALNGDGDKMAVGIYGNQRVKGALYLFNVNWNTGAITRVKKITHGTNIGGGRTLSLELLDTFGRSVALSDDGSKMIVGSPWGDNTGGALYLFNVNWNTGAITQVSKIKTGSNIGGGNTLESQSFFGKSVALNNDGTRMAVSSSGPVHLFTVNWSTGAVTRVKKITHGTNIGGGQTLDASGSNSYHSFGSIAFNGDGTKMTVGASNSYSGSPLRGFGVVYLFTVNWSTGAITQVGDKIGNGRTLVSSKSSISLNNHDHFGRSVAIDHNRLAVGADGDSSGKGAVYLFDYNRETGAVTQRKKITHGTDIGGGHTLSLHGNDNFGSSLAMRGDKLVVGVAGESSAKGAVYLFKTSWTNSALTITKHKRIGTVAAGTFPLSNNDRFGSAVALQGDKLAVGASGTGGKGAVYLFDVDWNSSTIGFTKRYKAEYHASLLPISSGDKFGSSLAMTGADGNYGFAVGASGTDSGKGAVYLYAVKWTDSTLSLQGSGKIKHNHKTQDNYTLSLSNGDNFGSAVAFGADSRGVYLVTGASGTDSNKGAVYIMNIGSNSWTRKITHGTKIGENPDSISLSNGDKFGSAIALDGYRLAVGAAGTDSGKGALYTYKVDWGVLKQSTRSSILTTNEITQKLNAGTDYTVVASNYITTWGDIIANPTGTGGKLSLIAGRSVYIHRKIDVKGGVKIIANASNATAGDNDDKTMPLSNRDDGYGSAKIYGDITSHGDVYIGVEDGKSGADKEKRRTGEIIIDGNITAKRITVQYKWYENQLRGHDGNYRIVEIKKGRTLHATDHHSNTYRTETDGYKTAQNTTIRIMADRLLNYGTIKVAHNKKFTIHLRTPEENYLGRLNYKYVITGISKMPEDTSSSDLYKELSYKTSDNKDLMKYIPNALRGKSAVIYGRSKPNRDITTGAYGLVYRGPIITKRYDGTSNAPYKIRHMKFYLYNGMGNPELSHYIREHWDSKVTHFHYKYRKVHWVKYFNHLGQETSENDATTVKAKFLMWGLQDINKRPVFTPFAYYEKSDSEFGGVKQGEQPWERRHSLYGKFTVKGAIYKPAQVVRAETKPVILQPQQAPKKDSTSSACLNLELEEVSTYLCFED